MPVGACRRGEESPPLRGVLLSPLQPSLNLCIVAQYKQHPRRVIVASALLDTPHTTEEAALWLAILVATREGLSLDNYLFEGGGT